jgi:FtsH-binding integral membrane protein
MAEAIQPSYLGDFPIAAEAGVVERMGFIRKTYAHLAGAVAAFVALEAVLFKLGVAEQFTRTLNTRGEWLLVLGAFMVVSWLANRWASSDASPALQYMGLGLYVAAEAVVFLPLLYVSARFGGKEVIPTAAFLTLMIFAGLSGAVFLTKKDFSFLAPFLWVAGLGAFGVMLFGALFGFSGGIFFTGGMIVFASGWILYDTSKVLHHYRVGQHVAASLALFSSVALLFWYVLRFVMSLNRR